VGLLLFQLPLTLPGAALFAPLPHAKGAGLDDPLLRRIPFPAPNRFWPSSIEAPFATKDLSSMPTPRTNMPPRTSVIPKRSEGSAFHAPEATNNREENQNNGAFRQSAASAAPKKHRWSNFLSRGFLARAFRKVQAQSKAKPNPPAPPHTSTPHLTPKKKGRKPA
jgi:hypothetical protein